VSSPQIDPRSRDQLVAETEDLAQSLSPWQRPTAGPDAGQALIRIFGRFAELVVDRLNRAPEKNFLAYLDLIGTTPIPPRPADRVAGSEAGIAQLIRPGAGKPNAGADATRHPSGPSGYRSDT